MTPQQQARLDEAWDAEPTSHKLELFRQLEVELPRNAEIQQQIGVCLIGLGDLDGARQVLSAAHELAEDGWTHLYLGNLDYRLADYAAAQAHFKRAAFLLPDDPMPLKCLADVFNATGEPEEAKALLRRIGERAVASEAPHPNKP